MENGLTFTDLMFLVGSTTGIAMAIIIFGQMFWTWINSDW